MGSQTPYTLQMAQTEHSSQIQQAPYASACMPTPNSVGGDAPNAHSFVPPKKPEVDILYKVIIGRWPELAEMPWEPQGCFLQKTLAEFTMEVPLELSSNGKGFLFTFTLESRLESTMFLCRAIESEQEGAFKLWQERVSRAVEEFQLREVGKYTRLTFSMSIEELNENTEVGGRNFFGNLSHGSKG